MSDDDELIDVRIDRLAPGGDAVGPQISNGDGNDGDGDRRGGANDGRTTFVALAAPGERVQARVTRRKTRVAWAELVAIREPSPVRVSPPCPWFGTCGGCQWQHVQLRAQRAAKRDIVARALGLREVKLIVPVETGQGYRDRARLVVGPAGQVGFRARRQHAVVDVDRCLLLAPELEPALGAIRASAPELAGGTEIDLQLGAEGVHVTLRLPGALAASAVVTDDVTRRVTHTVSGAALLEAWRPSGVVGVQVTGPGGGRTFGAADVDIAGPGETELRIPAGAFAQVGRAAHAALTAAVLDEIGPDPGAMLELYAGSGNFTRLVVGRARSLRAWDADATAVARGRRHVPQATWLDQPPSPLAVAADTVLVDPPREGLDRVTLSVAVQARRRIVYVSCDPQTLGRDAARLAQAGFSLGDVVALDLMPHTFHVEVVAAFDRR